MHRFFISPELISGDQVFFPTDLAHQIVRVLRLRLGDRVLVLDNSGLAREVELHTFGQREAQGTIRGVYPAAGEPRTQVDLYLALMKGKKVELVLQKGTELGVARFVPMVTRRSVVSSLRDLNDVRLDRWEAIIREAAEQSGRGILPAVSEPVMLESALGDARDGDHEIILAWEEADDLTLKEALAGRPEKVALFVGPEGGFDETEARLAAAYGASIVTLGPRILRAETAAVAVVVATLYELGEWE
jgi:16S rRNA (uracil1498-N3)-methyltransferase